MEEIIQNSKKHFYIVLVFTLSVLILGNVVSSSMIYAIIGILCWSMVYFKAKKKYNHGFAVIRILILSIPLSFTDVFGQVYGETIISWFNVFLLIMILTYIFKYIITGKVYVNYLSLLSLLIILISIVPALIGVNINDALKQYINTMVVFILVILGNSFKYNLTDRQKDLLKLDYVLGTIIAGIGVIVQILFIKILNIEVGNYNFLGGYRHAYGFLFGDYSFLSLYLVSGAMLLYFIGEKYSNSKIKLFIYISFLLITSILTSARTGIVSFIVMFVIYSIINSLRLIQKGSLKSFSVIVGNIILLTSSYLLVGKIRRISKFSDSGRKALNVKGFEIFKENIFCGIGFGENDYIGVFPHNLFFQSLAQGGLLYTIPLILFFFTVLWIAYKKDIKMVPVIACVLFGSLFIPNVLNSRFLPVLLLLLSIEI